MTDAPDNDKVFGVPEGDAGRDVPGDQAGRDVPRDGVVRDAQPDGAHGGVSGAATRFDDDRLLAYALGLEDDAELESALAGDETLRRRLEGMKAGLDDVEAGLERVVPTPGEDYADPAAARWDGLRPSFAPPPERRPSRRGWRVLVPVLGAVLALAVVGAFALRGGGVDSQTADERGAEATESLGAPEAGADAGKAAYGAEELARETEGFGTVFVARAEEIVDGAQRFTVVRRVKGLVTDDIYLEPGGRPVDEGVLAVVLLGPDSEEAVSSDLAGEALPYSYQGIEALVRPLAPGTDPEELVP